MPGFYAEYPVSGDVASSIDAAIAQANDAAARAEAAAVRAEAVKGLEGEINLTELNAIRAACETARDAAAASATAAETAKTAAATVATETTTLLTTVSAQIGSIEDSVDAASSSAASAGVQAAEAATSASAAAAEVARLSAVVRALSGVPVNDLTSASAGTYTLQNSDKFASIWRTRSDITKIEIPLNWHTAAADDGRPSVCWTRVYNRVNGNLEIAVPAASSNQVQIPTAPYGTWRTALSNGADEPAAQRTWTFDAPAGLNRKVAVQLAADLAIRPNPTTDTRTFSISSISGGATNIVKALADTGPGGHKDLSPKQTHVGWTFDLPDSASAATSHTITFEFPADVWCAVWRVTVAKDCSGVTITGATDTTAASTNTRSVTAVANGAVSYHNAFVGGVGTPMGTVVVPPNTTQKEAVSTGSAVGGADLSSYHAHTNPTSAGSLSFETGWSASAAETSYSFAVFSPVAGTSAVSILDDGDGSIMLPAYSDADIEMFSNGNTARVRLL